MQSARFVGLLVCLLSVASPATCANDWYVLSGGTGDGSSWTSPLPTVTAGLQAATEGDTVHVWAGVYHERITLKSGVTLIGGYLYLEGLVWWIPLTATLDGDNGGSVVTVETGAGRFTTLAGFVLRNGSGTRILREKGASGGGICCVDAGPTLLYNLITDCHADRGGGIVLYNSSPERSAVVKGCVIQNNQAGDGGGIYCLGGKAILDGCAIRGNTADGSGGGLAGRPTSDVLVSDCVFEANRAGILGNAVSLIQGVFRNNTVLRNVGLANGAVAVPSGSSVTVANSIIAFNSSGIYTGSNVTASLHHNDVFGNTAGNYVGFADPTGTNGNISKDPALEDPLVGIYTPCPGSPCVDKGDDTIVPPDQEDYHDQVRAQGVCVDIGAGEWPQPASRPAIRVSPNGDDGHSGEDWAQPKRTISAAVISAITSGREVWVAAGTYEESVSISNANVMLYGGFTGSETSRNQRDPQNNPTIVKQAAASSVFTLANVDRNTVIDGFSIMAGPWTYDTYGGRGGGINVARGSPVISDNIIADFAVDGIRTEGMGGGIYIDNGGAPLETAPIIACNTIQNNKAKDGGGVYVSGAYALVRNNVFRFNQGAWTTFYGFGAGGAICFRGSSGIITGNVIRGNSVQFGDGGGIWCSGSLTSSQVIIRDNRIENNYVYHIGAGIVCYSNDTQILSNRITGNKTDDRTGGIRGSGNGTIANNLIAQNVSYDPLSDASVVWGNGNVEVINNTITSGAAGVWLKVSEGDVGAYTFHVANNVIARTRVGILGKVNIESTVSLSNNCFFDTTTDYVGVTPGIGDLHAEPGFRDEIAGDYRLRPGSPCIDAGLDGAAIGPWDVAGLPRLQGSHADIGAWEAASWTGAMIPSVIGALRIAGGLQAADDLAMTQLDVVDPGRGEIDIHDAVRLARRAAGLD